MYTDAAEEPLEAGFTTYHHQLIDAKEHADGGDMTTNYTEQDVGGDQGTDADNTFADGQTLNWEATNETQGGGQEAAQEVQDPQYKWDNGKDGQRVGSSSHRTAGKEGASDVWNENDGDGPDEGNPNDGGYDGLYDE